MGCSGSRQHVESVVDASMDSTKGEPARPLFSRVAATLASQWALIAVLLMGAVAYVVPEPGVAMSATANPIVIASLFTILGLTMPLTAFYAGVTALHIHAYLQTFSLLLTPFAYWLLVYHWRWEVKLGLLTPAFAEGMLAAMCMPTTASTSLVFVQQTGGDTVVAALNMALAQLLGAAIAPVVSSSLLGGNGAHQDLAKTLWKMVKQIVLPLLAGMVIQATVMHILPPERRVPKMRAHLKRASNALLVFLFYMIFSKAFAHGSSSIGPLDFIKLTVWVTIIHVVTVLAAWVCAAPLLPERRVAFVLVAPQKTEAMAVAILAIVFDGSQYSQGELTIPIVVYHSVQMITAALVVPCLRGWLEKHNGGSGGSTGYSPDFASGSPSETEEALGNGRGPGGLVALLLQPRGGPRGRPRSDDSEAP